MHHSFCERGCIVELCQILVSNMLKSFLDGIANLTKRICNNSTSTCFRAPSVEIMHILFHAIASKKLSFVNILFQSDFISKIDTAMECLGMI